MYLHALKGVMTVSNRLTDHWQVNTPLYEGCWMCSETPCINDAAQRLAREVWGAHQAHCASTSTIWWINYFLFREAYSCCHATSSSVGLFLAWLLCFVSLFRYVVTPTNWSNFACNSNNEYFTLNFTRPNFVCPISLAPLNNEMGQVSWCLKTIHNKGSQPLA